MLKHTRFPLFFLLFLLLASQAKAGQFSILYENDALSFDNEDRYYTNGFEVSYLLDSNIKIALGHQVFTPANKPNLPLANDRPDVGYTFLSLSQHMLERPKDYAQIGSAELTIGFVGFDDASRELQNLAHDIFDDSKKFAYGAQIKNEPTLMFSFGYALSMNKALLAQKAATWTWDAQPRTFASIGTPYTRAGAGIELRLGRNLPISTYLPTIRPANGIKIELNEDDSDKLSFYVFSGLDAYLAIWNTFIDGNITGKNSPHVDMRVLVAEFSAGLVFSYKGLQITCANFMTTKEFETQDGPHWRGSLSLGYRF